MTPLLTINLIRALFVAFTAVVGVMVGEAHPWLGGSAGRGVWVVECWRIGS